MGGSSAAAGLWQSFAPPSVDPSRLTIVDTSHPDTISASNFGGVNVIASSKSGSTVETVALLAWALAHGLEARDLSVITDPGTPLAQLAHSMGSKVFFGDPETGGRFGCLSAFGIVPALAMGWTPIDLIDSVGSPTVGVDEFEHWFERGAALQPSDASAPWFPLAGAPVGGTSEMWLEQLVAETTGKDGLGLVPIVTTSSTIRRRDVTSGRDGFGWMVSVSALAWRLGVDPFDQPDVEITKRLTFGELERPTSWSSRTSLTTEERHWLSDSRYVALQVFGPLKIEQEVDDVRQRLGGSFPTVTAGLGPRFLHSTGQLHKGGPAGVVALQVVLRPTSTPERISGRRYSFHDLVVAQARADAHALRAAGRTVIELHLDQLSELCTVLGV